VSKTSRDNRPTSLVPLPGYVSSRKPVPGRWRKPTAIIVLLLLAIGVSGVQLFNQGGLAALVQREDQGPPLEPDRPTPGREEAALRLGTPTDVPPSPSPHHNFALRFPGQAMPVTWGPCRPIHYVVRKDNAPAAGARLLAQSFRQLSAATGLVFINDGSTDERPSLRRKKLQPKRYGDRWAPVLIAWTDPGEVIGLKKDAPASTGPQLFQPAGGELGFVSGFAYLHAPNLKKKMATLGEPFLHQVLLQQLARLVGLELVEKPGQVMSRRPGKKVLTSYQAGDLTGLNVLGSGACQPKV